MRWTSTSSWIYLAIFILAISDALFDLQTLRILTAYLVVAYLTLEIPRIPNSFKFIGGALLLGGLGVGWYTGGLEDAFFGGMARSQQILVFFAGLIWLQLPAARSPTLKSARDDVISRSPSQQFLFVSAFSHSITAGLGVAGMSMLATAAREQKDLLLRERLSKALVQGSTAASCWSPFIAGVPLVLSILPDVRWLDIALSGFLTAWLLVALSWLFDRITRRQGTIEESLRTGTEMSKPNIVRLAGIFVSLFLAVVFVGEVLGQPMLIAIGIVVPPYALVWSMSLTPPGQRKSTAASQFAKEGLEKLIELRNPALLIVSANFFGTSIAEVIPAQTVAGLVDTYAIAPDAMIVSLALLFLLCGPVGIHPLILIVLIGHLLPLGIFALPDQLIVLVLLAMWGIMTAVSPITNTTLFMAYFAQVSPWTVAVKWNGPYGIAATILVCLLAMIVRNMGLLSS